MRQRAVRPTPVVLAAVALAAVALALPAAGSAARADTAPGPWAEQVCAALAGWSVAAEQKSAALKKNLNPESLPQSRAVFSRFLDDVVRETDRMIVRIDIAGTSAVKSGPAIRQQLRSLMLRARGLIAAARRAAFAKGATAIGNTVGAQFDSLGGAFNRLERAYPSPELDRAITAEPACQDG